MDDNDLGDFGSDPYEFGNVIGDGDQPLYPNCSKYTKLSALVKIVNTSRRIASIRKYNTFLKEYEHSTHCPTYGISRWKEGKDSILKEGVPSKVRCLIRLILPLENSLMINGPSLVMSQET
ncbi:unnamed protein product [Prunus armeniaca]